MYQQESKEDDLTSSDQDKDMKQSNNNDLQQTSTPTTTTTSSSAAPGALPPPTTTATTPSSTTTQAKRINADDNNEPSLLAMNRQYCSSSTTTTNIPAGVADVAPPSFHELVDDTCRRGGIMVADYGTNTTSSMNENAGADIGSTLIRFGTTTAGDVSLTLGLRHAGNMPEKSSTFSVRDFGSC